MTNPIRVENADGTGLHAVSRPRLATEDDAGAAWSPDGTAIAFSRYVFYGKHTDYNRFGVWIVDVRTRHERRLTREYAGALAWSPTGDVIAADLGEDLDAKIALVRPDGAVVRTFTVPGYKGFNAGLSWSPDGTRLAVGGGAIVDRAGTIVGRYAPPSTDEQVSASPDWSPDGTTIAFARFATQINSRVNVRYALQSDLYEAPADGGEAVRLTRTPNLFEGGPRFRPRGGATPAGTRQECVLDGTAGPDLIRGTPRGDLVDAGPGSDAVYGGVGADVIDGGPATMSCGAETAATSCAAVRATTPSMRVTAPAMRSTAGRAVTAPGSTGSSTSSRTSKCSAKHGSDGTRARVGGAAMKT